MTKRIQPCSLEVRARAVRTVVDHRDEHSSQWAAIRSIASKIGCSGGTLRNWVREVAFAEAALTRDGAGALDTHADLDKGHGRIEERRMTVLRDTGWLDGERRFPGELRLPGAACLLRAETKVETRDTIRTETRYFISSRPLTAAEAATAVREHWAIENRLHWGRRRHLRDDQSRLGKGHGARNMATVRHFALNLVRTATDKRSIKSRRKVAGLGHRLPRSPHLLTARVTWIRSPGASGRRG